VEVDPSVSFPLITLDVAGVARVSATLPSSMPAGSRYLRAGALDHDSPNGLFTTSNRIEMRIPY
jgi:hypothetical protein